MLERLKNWMEKEGLKSSEFADIISVNRATISHILSGRNKPSIDFLSKLLKAFPKLNANWLITGIGAMYLEKEERKVISSKKIGKIIVMYDDDSYEEVEK